MEEDVSSVLLELMMEVKDPTETRAKFQETNLKRLAVSV
jgi:hypothetical protein